MENPSDREVMELVTFIRDLLHPEADKSTNIQLSFQLISNLDVTLRRKLFDEVIHGRRQT